MTHRETTTPVRIALAEDDDDLRKAFVGMLELLGNHVVCAAADGGELLEACSKEHVDLAMVDLDMPVVDGLEAAEQISERGIPVVLISGHPDVREVVVEHEPVVTRIVKPATLDSFRKAIAQALGTARQ
ncbi:MAG TPA: response regulator [Lacipirellula sp.]